MKNCAAIGLILVHSLAWAQLSSEAPTARASISAGALMQSMNVTLPNTPGFHVLGLSPTVGRFTGAFFFTSWLGVGLDTSFETFNVLAKSSAYDFGSAQVVGFRVLPSLVGRFAPLRWLQLELSLGFGGGQWAGFELPMSAGQPKLRAHNFGWVGVPLGFALCLEPDGWVGGQLWGRWVFGVTGRDGLNPQSFASGLQLFFGDLAIGNLHGALLIDLELDGVGANSANSHYDQLLLRFAAGVRFKHQVPRPAVPGGTGVGSSSPGRITGRVETNGVGLSGVRVTVGSLPEVTTATGGTFELAEVPPGRYEVKAITDGYKPATVSVEVKGGEAAAVALVLSKPTGPGRIKGVVKGEKDAPVEGAEVAMGAQTVKTAADGSFVIEQAGPGLVALKVKAAGYKSADESVQVPPEAEAAATLTLVKEGEKPQATIRGLVKSASGKPVPRVTVKISEVNLNVPLKADGRFVVQVPAGKYTLTIEAPGYIPQVKTVQVGEGDQAIFHCDLQPAGR